MATFVKTSIVIPVFNHWELTRDCLESIARTAPVEECEIIVVDNGSTDRTREACPALGGALFGERFVFLPQTRNLNYGPASNLGARHARGEYVLFLNNDIVTLPGWYAPLLKDFEDYPGLAGSGPLLTYPATDGGEDAVQHLGVFVSPVLNLGHLYEGVPATSLLARKRRFFQAITAAALLMPRAIFEDVGGFDERFINGFEDIDLCARLTKAGYRFTVNPASRMHHLTSQTPGRHAHEQQNFDILSAGSLRFLAPDWSQHLQNDGYELELTPWLTFAPRLRNSPGGLIESTMRSESEADVRKALDVLPYHADFYFRLAEHARKRGDFGRVHWLLLSVTKLRPRPEILFRVLEAGRDAPGEGAPDGVPDGARESTRDVRELALSYLISFCKPITAFEKSLSELLKWTESVGLEDLGRQCAAWLQKKNRFHAETLRPFMKDMVRLGTFSQCSPAVPEAYAAWLELTDRADMAATSSPASPDQETGTRDDHPVRFSIVMPVYNPKPDQLQEAVASLLDQRHPHWELCMADDCSTDPDARPLLEALAAGDPRIRVTFRSRNGNIAAASNTALEMAGFEYMALMDQDDALHPDALLEVARVIENHPDSALIYSDEDKFDGSGLRFAPYFKSDWDPVLAEGHNMVNHLGVYKTSLVREIGGFRPGYDGSQDYDMIWRFVERIAPEQIVHIPKVLYHWRAHEGSVALGANEKGEVVHANFRRALGEHLERTGLRAQVERTPGTDYSRVIHAMPAPVPLLSVILDAGDDCKALLSQASKWLAATPTAKQEVILVVGADQSGPEVRKLQDWAAGLKNARLCRTSAAPGSFWGARQDAAVREARGQILGFFGKGVLPMNAEWLTEALGRLSLPRAGAVGGKLILPDGRLASCGLAADASGRPFSLFRDLHSNDVGYFSWAKLARTVLGLDPRCLFTRRAAFEEAGGFGEAPAAFAALRYCRRLAGHGLTSVFTPFAPFLLKSGEDPAWASEFREMQDRAQSELALPPCNPNLAEGAGGFALSWKDAARALEAPGGRWEA